MKFIFVNILMGMYRGGGENYDLNISRELVTRGHKVELYSLRPIFLPPALQLPEYFLVHYVRAPWLYNWTQRMHAIPLIGRFSGLRGVPRALGQLIFELQVLLCLWRRRHEKFIVHICGLSLLGMLLTKILGPRIFLRMPGPPAFGIHSFFLRHTYAVIANGDAFESLRSLNADINLIRLEVGVDDLLFYRKTSRLAARKKLGLPREKLLAIFVGRFVPVKNVEMLIQTIARVVKVRDDIDLILVGTGPEHKKLEEKALKLGLEERIHFLNNAFGDRLRTCYTAADVFVLGSLYDNFPNVVLEAMSMELPVIATRVGGIPSQVFEGQTGYLVDPNDDEAMALRIIEMACAPKLRLALGQQAKQMVSKRFSWGLTAKKFLKVAKKLEYQNGSKS